MSKARNVARMDQCIQSFSRETWRELSLGTPIRR